MIHQPGQQLHRHVLERERRTVKQLQHELLRTDLIERHHRRVPEHRIGLVGHPAEIGLGRCLRPTNGRTTSTATSQYGRPKKPAIVSGVSCGQISGT